MENKKTFFGLDIGTDSVGYAVTDELYRLKKAGGEPVWGSHVFESAKLCAERRTFRTGRRRIDRRQQRVKLVRELFAEKIAEVDPAFYMRLDESALRAEDKTVSVCKYSFFNDQGFHDNEYHKKYPTIHHLILELMNSTEKHDVRLVYLAVAYLVAHRGHFLREVDKNNIESVLDFSSVYQDFTDFIRKMEKPLPWECDPMKIADILKSKSGIKSKEDKLRGLLFDGKKPVTTDDDFCDKALLVKLLCGGCVKTDKLFENIEYSDIPSLSLSMSDDTLQDVVSKLDNDDIDFIVTVKNIYDWSVLADIIGDSSCISEAKVKVYGQHKTDLHRLKRFIKKYIPGKYDEMFRTVNSKLDNYALYSYNVKSADMENKSDFKKVAKADFCKYLKSVVKDIAVEDVDREFYDDMLSRIETNTFLPKQVDSDNRVIPYQLYWYELDKILKSASSYLPFLCENGDDGITVSDKLRSVLEFRIPYYVGPLCRAGSDFAWIERKAEGKILPWNFVEKVDLDKSESSFINRMVGNCTYLPGEAVLPMNSLAYMKFTVLNEINNITISGNPIPTECKQRIYNELFLSHRKVTVKMIKDFLLSAGYMTAGDSMSGLDSTVKSALTSYHAFKKLLIDKKLTEDQVEDIILTLAYTEDRFRLIKHLHEKYPGLGDENIRYISSLKLKDFGRISRRFLCETECSDSKTGEVFPSVIEALWSTQNNLMQLLSSDSLLSRNIKEMSDDYYTENPRTLSEKLDDMYISNSVKRSIIRTLDVVGDLKKVCGKPDRIFIEMARGGKPEDKGKRTVSRRDQITELYKKFPKEEVRLLSEQLNTKEDRELQGEKLYLYFTQLGRCMYSGEIINLADLATETYNIEHIYPRCFVKDDSITNKALVLSKINGEKDDKYPIDNDIRVKMTSFWRRLLANGMINEEKFQRLTRNTPFSNDEKLGFINRQIVETRQSTKAVATLLSRQFPDTEIVYVKAKLVSEFRQNYGLLKCRSVNDLHHAKDAYLNIVVGNVYNSCFSKRYFNPDNYSMKSETIFERMNKCGNEIVWNGKQSIADVKRIVSKNAVHYTRYSFCRKGGFFNQQPEKASETSILVPRKKGLDPKKYGGYNNTTASFFVLVRYNAGKKRNVMVMPVELLYSDRYLSDEEFAKEYVRRTVGSIVNKEVTDIEFPLGKRILKINTMFSFNGFYACLAGKSNGGSTLILSSMNSLKVDAKTEEYIKRLESFSEKKKASPGLVLSEKYDKINAEQNTEIYDLLCKKLNNRPYSTFFSAFGRLLIESEIKFKELSTEAQIPCLINLLSVLKTGRTTGCDLTFAGGSKAAAICTVSSSLSNWERFKEVFIVDTTPSGIFKSVSGNLLDLL